MPPAMLTITAVIKTFERPERVVALHSSIRQYYPNLAIIIVDDSSAPIAYDWDEYTTYIFTEYDIGLSEGRNRAVDQVKTLYTLILDDDFVFTPPNTFGKVSARSR